MIILQLMCTYLQTHIVGHRPLSLACDATVDHSDPVVGEVEASRKGRDG